MRSSGVAAEAPLRPNGVAANVASYGGDQWTANQWNYNEVPGGPSGTWNNDGAC